MEAMLSNFTISEIVATCTFWAPLKQQPESSSRAAIFESNGSSNASVMLLGNVIFIHRRIGGWMWRTLPLHCILRNILLKAFLATPSHSEHTMLWRVVTLWTLLSTNCCWHKLSSGLFVAEMLTPSQSSLMPPVVAYKASFPEESHPLAFQELWT